MSESKDCFIFWDGDDVPNNERLIHYQCIECHKKNRKGFLWQARNGYGSVDIFCELCKGVIHKNQSKIILG